jgi:DNA-binding transcriptional MocR family regulator
VTGSWRAIAASIEQGALARWLQAGVGARRQPQDTVAAYDLLVAEDLVVRRQGSGTFVAGTDVPALPPEREGSALVHRLVDAGSGPGTTIDLSLSVIHDADDLDPIRLSRGELLQAGPASGYAPRGLLGLREVIAEHVRGWGLDADPDQVVVTTGAQQAISAAAACWVRPGDAVVVEDATYPGALAAFAQAGARVVGVAVDQHGARVAPLAAALEQRPALVYLQGLHSPTGAVLADRRRRDIAALADAARVPLVEDAALVDLAWASVPAPIASHAPHASIAVVGSLSKLFWGGLRVGFAVAPARSRSGWRVRPHDGLVGGGQALAEQLLRSAAPAGSVPAGVGPCRPATGGWRGSGPGHRRSWTPPRGGLSMWVRIPGDGDAFARHAARHGVLVASPVPLVPPGSGAHSDRIRLSFSAPEAELDEAVVRLAEAWATFPPP